MNSGNEWLVEDWEGDRIIDNNSSTHPVGEKKANEPGLYDMSGNIWDWTNTSSRSYRIIRSGSWNLFAYHYEVGKIRSSNQSFAQLFNILKIKVPLEIRVNISEKNRTIPLNY